MLTRFVMGELLTSLNYRIRWHPFYYDFIQSTTAGRKAYSADWCESQKRVWSD